MTMNKTKVRMSPDLLDYRQTMQQLVHEARDEKLQLAARAEVIQEPFPFVDIPAPEKAGLLTPPRVETLFGMIYLREGQTDGLIQINTVDVFGIEDIYVTLRDEAGNLLESGYAMRAEVCETSWGYIPCEPLTPGMPVVVRAVAADSLGGIGVAYAKITVEEPYQRLNQEGMA